MMFTIKCESCDSDTFVRDGYNNEDRVEIKIIGEQLVEIRCVCCDNVVVAVDGELM